MNLACSPCNQDHEKRKKMKILDKKSKHWMNTGNKHDNITSIGVVSLMFKRNIIFCKTII